MGNGRRRRRRAQFKRRLERLPGQLLSALAHVIDLPRQGETNVHEFANYVANIHKDKLAVNDRQLAQAMDLIREATITLKVLEQSPPIDVGRIELAKRKGEIRTHMVRLQGRLEAALRAHEALPVLKAHFEQQYRAILAVPRVLEAFVQPPRLVYRTDILYGKDKEGLWHKVGQFEISFDLINPGKETFTWKNLGGPVGHDKLMVEGPPNIYRNTERRVGVVNCFGDAEAGLRVARERLDYPALVAISVRYPECRGQSNLIARWPVVPASKVPQWYLDTFGV